MAARRRKLGARARRVGLGLRVAPVTVTRAPSRASSALPIAAPMPLVPPETSATLVARTSLRCGYGRRDHRRHVICQQRDHVGVARQRRAPRRSRSSPAPPRRWRSAPPQPASSPATSRCGERAVETVAGAGRIDRVDAVPGDVARVPRRSTPDASAGPSSARPAARRGAWHASRIASVSSRSDS